jgi:hypothetical protein
MRLLDRQETVCQELMHRCDRQTELICEHRSDELLALMNERQHLIDELGSLAHSLEPYRAAWPNIWQSLGAGDREAVQERVDSVQRIVGDVMNHDHEDESRIEIERGRIREEIETITTGRTTANAYGRDASRGVNRITNRFTDERG